MGKDKTLTEVFEELEIEWGQKQAIKLKERSEGE